MNSKAKIKTTLSRIIKVIAVPLIVYLLFTILSGGSFGSARSMISIFKTCCYSVALSWALMIMWSAGIHSMCIGAVMLLSAIVGGNIAKMLGFGLAGQTICIIVSAIVIQTISSLITCFVRVPSMVTSFGLLMIYESMTQFLFNKQGITSPYYTLGQEPWCYIALGVTAILVVILYYFTRFGNRMQALGKAPEIVQNMGVGVKKTRVVSFIMSGLFVGIAAVMFLTKSGTITSVAELGSMIYSFNAIIGVVIGLFLSAYCHPIIATFLGSFIMNMLSMGLLSLGITSSGQNICIGIFLLLFMAISINQYKFMQNIKDKRRAKMLQAQLDKQSGLLA